MDDSALKTALRKLLAHGEAAQDNAMVKLAASKKSPPPVAAELCEDCKVAMVDSKCPDCGKELDGPADGESDLAELLESGAEA